MHCCALERLLAATVPVLLTPRCSPARSFPRLFVCAALMATEAETKLGPLRSAVKEQVRTIAVEPRTGIDNIYSVTGAYYLCLRGPCLVAVIRGNNVQYKGGQDLLLYENKHFVFTKLLLSGSSWEADVHSLP